MNKFDPRGSLPRLYLYSFGNLINKPKVWSFFLWFIHIPGSHIHDNWAISGELLQLNYFRYKSAWLDANIILEISDEWIMVLAVELIKFLQILFQVYCKFEKLIWALYDVYASLLNTFHNLTTVLINEKIQVLSS